jgi:hypothetical protein
MNHILAILLLMLLAAVTVPALTANAAVSSNETTMAPASEPSASPTALDVETASPVTDTQKSIAPPAPLRAANKERSKRPARIDMTMPFYRFGRLPIRIKE